VTAASLYEAVAQGLAAFRGDDWVADFGARTGVVKVSVAEIRVEHEVRGEGLYELAGEAGQVSS
jgi:hypothetical protein